MYHPSVMLFKARKKGGWMTLKLRTKESTYSKETLEKIKNHYIKEEDAWRHMFAEINSYIKKEITWIRTST